MTEIIGEVTGINYYPIKSCQAATVNGEKPTVLETGITGFEAYGVPDRGLVIADELGNFVSRRGWDIDETVKFPGDAVALAQVAVDVREGAIRINHPQVDGLVLPNHHKDIDGSKVDIFGTDYVGVDVGDEAAEYFSEVLGRAVRLVGYHPQVGSRSIKKPEYHHPDAVNEVAGADGFPFLWVSQTSLDQAHSAKDIPLGTQPIGAYRGNVETELHEPWIEDRTKVVQFGEEFQAYVESACSRCPIPNQDVMTGENTGASDQLLYPIRNGWKLGEDTAEKKSKRYFGQNLNHTLGSVGSIVRVGDPVYGLEFGEPNFVPKIR